MHFSLFWTALACDILSAILFIIDTILKDKFDDEIDALSRFIGTIEVGGKRFKAMNFQPGAVSKEGVDLADAAQIMAEASEMANTENMQQMLDLKAKISKWRKRFPLAYAALAFLVLGIVLHAVEGYRQQHEQKVTGQVMFQLTVNA